MAAARRRVTPVGWLLAAFLAIPAPGAAAAGPAAEAAAEAATEVRVAVAANFATTLRGLQPLFERASGHRLAISAGSTGALAAQARAGAPFAVLLAADAERPAALERDGVAVVGSRFTYALGRLVLWSPDPDRVDAAGRVLQGDGFRHLAIANPRLAPYGVAAQEALGKLGLWDRLQPRLVLGEDVGQAFAFVASGAAELGLVALSQVPAGEGSRWLVPEDLHAPIAQQAVLLAPGRDDAAARAFLDFLRGEAARAAIAAAGYGLPPVR